MASRKDRAALTCYLMWGAGYYVQLLMMVEAAELAAGRPSYLQQLVRDAEAAARVDVGQAVDHG